MTFEEMQQIIQGMLAVQQELQASQITLKEEIADLKEARDIFLEETAVLNARNEELAQLNTQYEKRVEQLKEKSLPIRGKPTVKRDYRT